MVINKSLKSKPIGGTDRQVLTGNGCCAKEEEELLVITFTKEMIIIYIKNSLKISVGIIQ